MIDKTTNISALSIDWSNVGLWLWSICMCLLGGLVRWSQNVQSGHTRPWNFTELIGEMAMSAFVGSMAYKLSMGLHCPADFVPAVVGVTSHMGARALFKFEVFANVLANRKMGLPDDASTAPAAPASSTGGSNAA